MKELRQSLKKALLLLPDPIFGFIVNLIFILRRLDTRVTKQSGRWVVNENNDCLHLVHKTRVFLYLKGISNRLRQLDENYMISQVLNELDIDAFVDVGANIGELSRLHKLPYFAFEPGETEFACLQVNVPDAKKNVNIGLWYEKTTLTFYEASSTADSSFIEPQNYSSSFHMNVDRLDSYDILENVFLKVEAEGAEIEVLQGAEKILSRASCIAVDTGFERGVTCESTTVEVIDFLYNNNFRLVDFTAGRMILLFYRQDLIDRAC